MRSALALVVSVFLLALAAAPAGARGTWVRLGEIIVQTGTETTRLDLTKVHGLSKAVRLDASAGKVDIERVTVGYSNGQAYYHDRAFSLAPPERTRPIDERDEAEARFIDEVEIVFAKGGPKEPSRVLVYGLQSDAGAAVRRVAAEGASEPPAETDAAGETATGEAAADVIATADVSLSVDRDVVPITNASPTISEVRIRARDGQIRILSAIVVYLDGRLETLAIDEEIASGSATRWLSIPSGAMQAVRLTYRPHPASGSRVGLDIEAKAPDGQKKAKRRSVRPKKLEPPVADASFVEVPVFFGTDRQREKDRDKGGRKLATFSGRAADTLTLGTAIVTVPTREDRERGVITRPGWNLLVTTVSLVEKENVTRHFTIKAVDTMSEDELIAGIKRRLASAKEFRNEAVVFVHGYNVSFDDALFRAAQIAYDTGFDGAACVYSWPSLGSVLGYVHDKNQVLGARDHLANYLDMVRRRSGATKIHLIAHSMGGHLLTEVLRDMTRGLRPDDPSLRFNEIVFASPDVTRENFERIARELVPHADGITLYASSKDKALNVSGKLSLGKLPAGYIPSSGLPVILQGVDSIDASAVSTDVFGLNHSDFADRRHLLADIALLFRTGSHPPSKRVANTFEEIKARAGPFWRLRPAPQDR
ncbi:MAG: alpha/beta fold hydrolase [Hyphomicrobiaceae bacterium]|nr:alpha/beta fold hydrolase [Hyphomicrobiaceae bacterium]